MNVNQPLKYSIIIPAHNEENFIGKTLESVVQQTVLPHQLIVVNDNSTDQTEKIVQKFTKNIHLFNVFILLQNPINIFLATK